tara:strand:- start:282 stop:455 length:174 start_codon:yes stop_codon:yes gene_type:complete
MNFKPVTRYTRSGIYGKVIECPECNHQERVYHFAWSALGCQSCKDMIDKYKWKVEVA